MAGSSFGKTWWGQEWLNALKNIDYANRIPRGATYARNGAVKELKVSGGLISAQVQGTQRTPYKVNIAVPAADPKRVQRLVDEVAEQPLLVSKLMNHELDPQLMNLARQVGISLFPSSWQDLDMSCSCPDWAVPCKHIAAVVYMMSREIDNDPFLVFRMRGIDLVGELAARGVSGGEERMQAVGTVEELYEVEKTDVEPVPQPPHPIDLTRLTNIQQALVDMLPKEPPFGKGGDFRGSYRKSLAAVARQARRILEGRVPLPLEAGAAPRPQDTVQLLLDEEMQVTNLSFDRLLSDVAAIDEDDLPDYGPAVAVMRHALNVALHLLACGAVQPKIVVGERRLYSVVWQPVVAHESVGRVVEQLGAMMPADLVRWQQPQLKHPSRLKNRGMVLLTLVVNALLPRLAPKADPGEKILSLFFNGCGCRFGEVGEAGVPESIAAWLGHAQLGAHEYCPQVVVGIAAADTFTLELSALVEGVPVPLRHILAQKEYAPVRLGVLRDAALLSPYLPSLDQYLNGGAKTPMRFKVENFAKMMLEVFPVLRLLGVGVALPKQLQDICRPRPTVTIRQSQGDGVAHVSMADLLDFDWQVAIGDEVVSVEEFRQLVGRAHGLLHFKGRYFYVDESDLHRLDQYFDEARPLTAGERLQAALSENFEGVPVTMTDEVRQLMQQLKKQPKLPVPKGIRARLRPYQQRGYEWMYRNAKLGFGSIIADDMGLGKTLQVIALLQRLKDEGALGRQHVLVVVPTTLLSNWQAELVRFAPDLSCRLYHGPQRSLKGFDEDLLLTTYGVVRSDLTALKRRKWHTVVIDEAQNIKNASTAQSRAVHALPAQNRIAMSGTPIENRMSEFWSIMDFANPRMLGSAETFRKCYANPIQREGDKAVAERFRQVTAPFLLRRLKTDRNIISDLPDKIEEDTYTALTDQQAALYQQTLEAAMAVIDDAPDDTPQALFKRRGLVLQMILSLKQICNHPTLYLKNGVTDPSLSGKAETLLTLLDSIVRNHQKVLVFTQFKEMGDLLVRFVGDRLGERPLFLHGGLSVKERTRLVEDFQTRPECHIFILSIKAAGTGLNLTAANHVIHYDLWWNPAVEAQATDRAYRIGQHQNVIVHRFITQGTFEEQINRMIQEKRRLADLTVAVGESWIGNLSNAELHELFGRKE